MIFKFEIGPQIGTFSIAYKCNNILLSGLELCGKPESREKSKNRKKSEKSDLVSYPTYWQICQNTMKCHKMPKCLHFGSGSCIRIFFFERL